MTEATTANSSINYRVHVPISLLLVTIYFFIPTIASKYYESIVIEKLRNCSQANGVYRLGEYTPINKEIAPKTYLFVKISRRNSETIENYYELNGRVTRAIYLNSEWQQSEIRSYKEDYLYTGPLVGFVLIGLAAVSRVLRILFRGHLSEFIWREFDFWKYPFTTAEKIALVYGLPSFMAGFLIGLAT